MASPPAESRPAKISMTIDVGNTIGDYEVLAFLGAGGAGRVYKVRHAITGRIEALKILLPDHAQDEHAERFLREVKVQANLSHPNIAAVLNAFRVERTLVMVMELVKGESLDKLIARGRLPLEQALDYASQALSALGYAHARGVIHRDIKPENMLVTAQRTLKVTDFGLAKSATDARLTVTGATLGSLYYMSPEQVNGIPNLDERTDVYSMGIVLYELVTGRRPFDSEQPFHLMLAHVEQQPKPPVELDPSLTESLSVVILRALEKRPEDRFESAGVFWRAMEAARQAPLSGPARSVAGAILKVGGPDPPGLTAAPDLAPDDIPASQRDHPTAARPRESLGIFGARGLWITVSCIALVASLAAFVAWRISRPDPSKTVAVPSGSHHLLRKVIPEGTVQAVVFSAAGELTAVLTDKGVVEVWESESGKQRATFSAADKHSKALALSPSGNLLVFAGDDARLGLWDVDTRHEQLRLDEARAVRSLALSSDGGLLAAASDRFLTVWEIDGAGGKPPLQRQELSAHVVIFRPDGATVAVAVENSIHVQPLQQSGESSHLPMFDGGATALAFNSGRDVLSAAGQDGLKVWNSNTFEEVLSTKLPGDPFALGFTRSGHCVALTSTGQSAQIWDATVGAEVSSFLHNHDVKAAALTTDGRFAATATAAGDLWIWKADVAWDRPDSTPRKNDLHSTPRKNILRRFMDVLRGKKWHGY